MKIVLDTNVLVAGLRSTIGASRLILLAAGERIVVPLCNVAMMLEYEEVLKRQPNLTATGMTEASVDTFLDAFSALVEPVPPGFAHRPVLPDSDDEAFLEAAINGRADALVTHNVLDFRDTDPHALPHGMPIVRPGDFLRRLSWRPSATMRSVFRIP